MANAEHLYRQVLQSQPNQPDALHLLGVVSHQMGKAETAVNLITKALAVKPDFADALNSLGNVLKDQGNTDKAIENYRQALAINPDYVEAHNNLGNAFLNLERLEDAVLSYREALTINPDYIISYSNLSFTLQKLGRLDEAVQLLQSALERQPGHRQITENLIDLLNYHQPAATIRGAHAKVQKALQEIPPNILCPPQITDDAVRQVYQLCQSTLAAHDLGNDDFASHTQIWWGEYINLGCSRHMEVFKTFKIIPEFCFGCYKISVEPRTVVELLKLKLVFDILELPNDNTRKCLVEVRPEISGAYKGLIYYQNRGDGEEILNIVRSVVGEKISKNIPISAKRRCSEYPLVYPDFSRVGDNETPPMTLPRRMAGA